MPLKRTIRAGSLIALIALTPLFALNSGSTGSGTSLHKQTAAPLVSDTLTMRYDPEGTTPIFISGTISINPVALPSLQKASAAAQKRILCQQYLSRISHALRISNPSKEFSILDAPDNTPDAAHYKLKQIFNGVPVLGAEATLHLHGDQAEFIGRTSATPTISTLPSIDAPQAITIVIGDLRSSGHPITELSAQEQQILDYSSPSATLVITPSPQRLAYQVLIRPNMLEWWEYVIDAKNGQVISKYNRTCHVGDATTNLRDLSGTQRTIHTYQTDKYYLIDASRPMFNALQSQIPSKLTGAIVTYDYLNKYPATSPFNLITSTNNSSWDAKAVSAQYNASVAYEYYKTTHNRNSINGKGGSILSFINVAEKNGAAMDNAYWNGRGMYYGNGLRVFTPLAAGLDVAGHELTHGVVEATAALRYTGQSGALNESFADIFGCMIERANWKMGETIVRPGVYASNTMRDLANPHNGTTKGKQGWQPQSMSEYQKLANTTAGDNGGVHINNGIPNYAYYLFATAVSKETAERVYYRTLTTYLSASSQFADLRIGATLACEELYGKESTETKALSKAFDSVGIFDNTQPFEHVADLPVNPGKEYVLLTAAPPASDGTTLYLADSSFGSLKSISKRSVKFRPSISDDGKKVLFVSGDKQLISLTLNGPAATETIIDTAKVWSLCAISRDGQRFAAVREKKDTAIYIGSMHDGEAHQARKFNLNGPSESVSHAVTGAVNSTALEWNFAGDAVIYDVYNSLSGAGGTTLTNWDIGFLRGWDPNQNAFGDGEVDKLFNNLGDGISVGNPTYSKNSPNIIAYENIDNLTGTISVVTMNMENRKTVTIANTAFPGYPSFSKRDDRISFSTINGTDTVISIVKVKTDKQTVDGSPTIAVRKMKWAVFFASGSRGLTPIRPKMEQQSMPVQKFDVSVLPCKNGLKALIVGTGKAPVRISIARADGKLVRRETLAAGSELISYSWNGNITRGTATGCGVYFIRVESVSGAVAKMFSLVR